MQPTKRFHYAWVVLGVTFLALLVGMGARASFGVFIKALEGEFHVTREETSSIASISLLLFAFSQPLIGLLLDRLGARRILAASLLLIGLGTIATSMVTGFWQLYLVYGVVGGIAAGGASITAGAFVATRWFTQRRGLAIGIAGAGASAGQLVFLPLASILLAWYGWRQSYLLQGIAVTFLMFPVVAWLLRCDPADVGLAPYGAEPPGPSGDVSGAAARMPRVSIVEAARSLDFWWLALGYFVCGYTTAGMAQTHLIPYWVEHGFHEVQAANAMSLMGAMNVVGTIFSGRLCDRYGSRIPLSIYYFTRGIAILFLLVVTDGVSIAIWAVIFGLSYIATVPPVSSLTADLFGKASMGGVYGWITCSHQIGGALGAYLSGVLYTQTGSYAGAFTAAAALCFIASAMSYAIRETPRPPVPVPAPS